MGVSENGGVPYLGVLIERILLLRGTILGSPIFGNSHIFLVSLGVLLRFQRKDRAVYFSKVQRSNLHSALYPKTCKRGHKVMKLTCDTLT